MNDRDQKTKEEAIELTGTVTEEVRGAFRVKLDDMEHTVLCRLAGKMRKFKIRVVPGDNVDPIIWKDYERVIREREGDKKIGHVERFAFYERAKQCYAVVATGESALYANIILKKGVVK